MNLYFTPGKQFNLHPPLVNRSFVHSVAGRVVAVCVVTALVFGAQPLLAQQPATPSATALAVAPSGSPSPAPVAAVIAPGCELAITVKGEAELSGAQTVADDGTVHFVISGTTGAAKTQWSVNVKDKTADQARLAIANSLKLYVKNPIVEVTVAKLPPFQVEVHGAAEKVGPLPLPVNAHLSDALARCAYKTNADLEHILILRHIKVEPTAQAPTVSTVSVSLPRKTITLRVNYLTSEKADGSDDPLLMEGDSIYLPYLLVTDQTETAFRTVRIVGEVDREASLPYHAGMTVKEALAGVGGVKSTADATKVRLIRGDDGRILQFDAEKANADDSSNNLVLHAGDLIMVDRRDRALQFAVLGEVTRPATVEIDPKQKYTVSQALTMVGGLNHKADRHKGVLRKGYLLNPAATRDIAFDPERVMSRVERDLDVDAGDAIVILPHVHRPGFFEQLVPVLFHFLPLGL